MSFNVICNSDDAHYGDNDVYDLTYQFDWCSIPEGEYEMTWSFQMHLKSHPVSGNDHFEHAVSSISLRDLGIKNTYRCLEEQSSAATSGVIGFCQQLLPEGSNANADNNDDKVWTKAISYATWNDNPPVKLMRPTSNTFRVVMLGKSLEIQTYVNKAYTLILHFKKC